MLFAMLGFSATQSTFILARAFAGVDVFIHGASQIAQADAGGGPFEISVNLSSASDNASQAVQVAVRSSPVNLHRGLFTRHVGLTPHSGRAWADVTAVAAGVSVGTCGQRCLLDPSPVAHRVEACMSIRELMQAAM